MTVNNIPNASTDEDKSMKYRVVRGNEGYTSKLVACRSFKKGDVLEHLTGTTPASKKYTTVQINEKEHIELNSDVVYMNHSCDPTCIMDVKNMLVRLTKDVPTDGELTFFYPSTEWDMGQPFKCWCESPGCIETVKGAKYLPKELLSNYFINEHILMLHDKNN